MVSREVIDKDPYDEYIANLIEQEIWWNNITDDNYSNVKIPTYMSHSKNPNVDYIQCTIFDKLEMVCCTAYISK